MKELGVLTDVRFCPKAKVLVTKMQRAKRVKATEMAATVE